MENKDKIALERICLKIEKLQHYLNGVRNELKSLVSASTFNIDDYEWKEGNWHKKSK